MAAARIVLLGGLLLAACNSMSGPFPGADCRVSDGCDEALDAAADVIQGEATQSSVDVVVVPGRGPGVFHAEVHVCVGDGDYVLIDVVGPDKTNVEATRRLEGWSDPPCD
jgi:predicted small secreted protein